MPNVTRHLEFDIGRLKRSSFGHPYMSLQHFSVQVRAQLPKGAGIDAINAALACLQHDLGDWVAFEWDHKLYVTPEEHGMAAVYLQRRWEGPPYTVFAETPLDPQQVCDRLLAEGQKPHLRQGMLIDLVFAQSLTDEWHEARLPAEDVKAFVSGKASGHDTLQSGLRLVHNAGQDCPPPVDTRTPPQPSQSAASCSSPQALTQTTPHPKTNFTST